MNNATARVLLSALLVISSQALAAQTRTVSLVTSDWEPYIGEKLPGKGYVYEIVVDAFRSVGYQVDITFYPWARALNEAESGRADALFPEYFDEGRQTLFAFSHSFPGGPVGFLARKDSRIIFPADPRKEPAKVFQGMQQYSFGVVRGYVNTKAFDAATFLKKDEATSDEQNIQKLQMRRTDLIFIDRFAAQYLLKTKFSTFASDLEFLNPPLEVKSLYLAFSRKAPGYEQKLQAFNEGLAKLQKAGAIKTIMKKYGF